MQRKCIKCGNLKWAIDFKKEYGNTCTSCIKKAADIAKHKIEKMDKHKKEMRQLLIAIGKAVYVRKSKLEVRCCMQDIKKFLESCGINLESEDICDAKCYE